MTGTGHSFTGIAAPEHTLLRPEGLTGVLEVDREAMTVTARAGTQLKDLNLALERLGLSLHNMGDIAEQTLAGATSTGTHGTGGIAAGLAAQLEAIELVDGTGEVVRATREENPDVLDVARTDWVSRAEEIAHPLLIIHSVDDEFVPSGPSEQLAAARPDLVTLPQWTTARHTKEWNTDPDRWDAQLAAFVAGQRLPADG